MKWVFSTWDGVFNSLKRAPILERCIRNLEREVKSSCATFVILQMRNWGLGRLSESAAVRTPLSSLSPWNRLGSWEASSVCSVLPTVTFPAGEFLLPCPLDDKCLREDEQCYLFRGMRWIGLWWGGNDISKEVLLFWFFDRYWNKDGGNVCLKCFLYVFWQSQFVLCPASWKCGSGLSESHHLSTSSSPKLPPIGCAVNQTSNVFLWEIAHLLLICPDKAYHTLE